MPAAKRQPTILYELYNSTLPRGTGIATYARVLCGAAAELGFRTEGLFYTRRPLSRRDPILAQIQFADDGHRKPKVTDWMFGKALRWTVGMPDGFKPMPLPTGHVVVEPGAVGGLMKDLDVSLIAPRFMEASRLHFKRYGSAASVHMPAPPDIFHTTQAIPLRVPGARNIYTIHDLVPLRLPHTTDDDKKYFYAMARYLGRTADRIVTVSEASKRDLVEVAGIPEEKVVNTYQAVAFPEDLAAMTKDEAARLVESSFNLKADGYFLFYGALEPKKNVGRIVDAHAASGTTRPLVIAGGLGWKHEADVEKINENKVGGLRRVGELFIQEDRIKRLQFIPLYQLVALIRSARALVFPSLYEGFGLPVLEAMLLGTPVITSRTSSLGEVAGQAAVLVEPTNVAEIARAIQGVDTDDALCDALRAKGLVQAAKFSMSAYKEKLGRLYDDVLAMPPTSLRESGRS